MGFKKCTRPCRFRSSKPDVNGCDYAYLTGKLRGCEPGKNCTKFEEGARIKPGWEIKIACPEKFDNGAKIIAGDVKDQKRRPIFW